MLRVPFDGRSLVREADVMRYAHERGYPVPKVYDAGDGFLVMDRVDGPTMLDIALKRPYRLRVYGRLLARLHERLHALPAPDWLPDAPLPGDRLLHRDLHPLNVLMGPDGPVVVDCANAARGDPSYDVADAWVLFACAGAPVHGVERAMAAAARRLFLASFLRPLDRAAARAAIPAVVAHRLTDRNHTPDEHQRMRELADWASKGLRRD